MRWLVDTSLLLELYYSRVAGGAIVKVLRRLVSRRGIFVLGYVVWLQLVEEARGIRKRQGLREVQDSVTGRL